MRNTLFAALTLAALALPAMAATGQGSPAGTTDPAAVKAGSYRLDPAHGKITWSVNHLGFSTYIGQFSKVTAKLSLQPLDPPPIEPDRQRRYEQPRHVQPGLGQNPEKPRVFRRCAISDCNLHLHPHPAHRQKHRERGRQPDPARRHPADHPRSHLQPGRRIPRWNIPTSPASPPPQRSPAQISG